MLKMTLAPAMAETILQKLDRMQDEGENWVVLDLVPDAPMTIETLSFWETAAEAVEICGFSNKTGAVWETDQNAAHSDFMSIEEFRYRLAGRADEQSIQIPARLTASSEREIVNPLNTPIMIQKNVNYLADQVKFAGMGDQHGEAIAKQMEALPEKFQLQHEAAFNGQKVQAVMDFSKSKESEMYFFNKYHLTLTPESGGTAMTQQFYIQQKGQSVTLKEAYNLMNGRAVYKSELANKEGETYAAWLKMNFKEQDTNGGFKLKPYNEKYGFKLEEALSKQPIMELVSAADKEKLIASLEKGNRAAVTYNLDGKLEKRFIEAAPTSHGLNVFDEQQRLIKQEWQPKQEQKQGEGQADENKNKNRQRQGAA